MSCQKLEELEFFAGEVDLLAGDRDSAVVKIHPQVTVFKDPFFLFLFVLPAAGYAADDRLDPRFHLQNIERLRDIVVCAVVKSEDLVHILSLGSEHDNRNRGEFPDLL